GVTIMGLIIYGVGNRRLGVVNARGGVAPVPTPL
ncbi:hypothetical protein MNBD_ACTINO02-2893, partial [hydrothermal vent metagenome]